MSETSDAGSSDTIRQRKLYFGVEIETIFPWVYEDSADPELKVKPRDGNEACLAPLLCLKRPSPLLGSMRRFEYYQIHDKITAVLKKHGFPVQIDADDGAPYTS